MIGRSNISVNAILGRNRGIQYRRVSGISGLVQLSINFVSTDLIFKWKAPSTSTLIFHWGDGTISEVAGSDSILITTTSNYSAAGNYNFWITGDVLDLTYIDISGQDFVSGDASSWDAAFLFLYFVNTIGTSVTGATDNTELYVLANAAALVPDEKNDIAMGTNGGEYALNGTGSNILESQSTEKTNGSWGLHAESNHTPTSNARFYTDISFSSAMADGDQSLIQCAIRHVGTGLNWGVYLGAGNSSVDHLVVNVGVGVITFQYANLEFVYDDTYRFIVCKEVSGSNNGGVYVDGISVKKLFPKSLYGRSYISTFINSVRNWSSGLIKTVHIGDSLTQSIYECMQLMISQFSVNGGGGYIGFVNSSVYQTAESGSPGLITKNVTPEWTKIDSATATDAEERGMQMESIVTSDNAAIANVELHELTSTSITIWYYQDVDHGKFNYYIDGAGETTIDTAGVAGLKSVTISGLADTTHKMNIRNVVDGVVRIYGVSFEKATGLRTNYLPNGGSKTDQWALTSLLGSYISAESPNFVSIMLGANDAEDKSKETYKAELKTIIDLVQDNSSAEILILTPNDRNPSGAAGYVAKIATFIEAIQELVIEEDIAFFDLNGFWYSYSESSALGLLADDIHPNAAGRLDQGQKIYKSIIGVQ